MNDDGGGDDIPELSLDEDSPAHVEISGSENIASPSPVIEQSTGQAYSPTVSPIIRPQPEHSSSNNPLPMLEVTRQQSSAPLTPSSLLLKQPKKPFVSISASDLSNFLSNWPRDPQTGEPSEVDASGSPAWWPGDIPRDRRSPQEINRIRKLRDEISSVPGRRERWERAQNEYERRRWNFLLAFPRNSETSEPISIWEQNSSNILSRFKHLTQLEIRWRYQLNDSSVKRHVNFLLNCTKTPSPPKLTDNATETQKNEYEVALQNTGLPQVANEQTLDAEELRWLAQLKQTESPIRKAWDHFNNKMEQFPELDRRQQIERVWETREQARADSQRKIFKRRDTQSTPISAASSIYGSVQAGLISGQPRTVEATVPHFRRHQASAIKWEDAIIWEEFLEQTLRRRTEESADRNRRRAATEAANAIHDEAESAFNRVKQLRPRLRSIQEQRRDLNIGDLWPILQAREHHFSRDISREEFMMGYPRFPSGTPLSLFTLATPNENEWHKELSSLEQRKLADFLASWPADQNGEPKQYPTAVPEYAKNIYEQLINPDSSEYKAWKALRSSIDDSIQNRQQRLDDMRRNWYADYRENARRRLPYRLGMLRNDQIDLQIQEIKFEADLLKSHPEIATLPLMRNRLESTFTLQIHALTESLETIQLLMKNRPAFEQRALGSIISFLNTTIDSLNTNRDSTNTLYDALERLMQDATPFKEWKDDDDQRQDLLEKLQEEITKADGNYQKNVRWINRIVLHLAPDLFTNEERVSIQNDAATTEMLIGFLRQIPTKTSLNEEDQQRVTENRQSIRRLYTQVDSSRSNNNDLLTIALWSSEIAFLTKALYSAENQLNEPLLKEIRELRRLQKSAIEMVVKRIQNTRPALNIRYQDTLENLQTKFKRQRSVLEEIEADIHSFQQTLRHHEAASLLTEMEEVSVNDESLIEHEEQELILGTAIAKKRINGLNQMYEESLNRLRQTWTLTQAHDQLSQQSFNSNLHTALSKSIKIIENNQTALRETEQGLPSLSAKQLEELYARLIIAERNVLNNFSEAESTVSTHSGSDSDTSDNHLDLEKLFEQDQQEQEIRPAVLREWEKLENVYNEVMENYKRLSQQVKPTLLEKWTTPVQKQFLSQLAKSSQLNSLQNTINTLGKARAEIDRHAPVETLSEAIADWEDIQSQFDTSFILLQRQGNLLTNLESVINSIEERIQRRKKIINTLETNASLWQTFSSIQREDEMMLRKARDGIVWLGTLDATSAARQSTHKKLTQLESIPAQETVRREQEVKRIDATRQLQKFIAALNTKRELIQRCQQISHDELTTEQEATKMIALVQREIDAANTLLMITFSTQSVERSHFLLAETVDNAVTFQHQKNLIQQNIRLVELQTRALQIDISLMEMESLLRHFPNQLEKNPMELAIREDIQASRQALREFTSGAAPGGKMAHLRMQITPLSAVVREPTTLDISTLKQAAEDNSFLQQFQEADYTLFEIRKRIDTLRMSLLQSRQPLNVSGALNQFPILLGQLDQQMTETKTQIQTLNLIRNAKINNLPIVVMTDLENRLQRQNAALTGDYSRMNEADAKFGEVNLLKKLHSSDPECWAEAKQTLYSLESERQNHINEPLANLYALVIPALRERLARHHRSTIALIQRWEYHHNLGENELKDLQHLQETINQINTLRNQLSDAPKDVNALQFIAHQVNHLDQNRPHQLQQLVDAELTRLEAELIKQRNVIRELTPEVQQGLIDELNTQNGRLQQARIDLSNANLNPEENAQTFVRLVNHMPEEINALVMRNQLLPGVQQQSTLQKKLESFRDELNGQLHRLNVLPNEAESTWNIISVQLRDPSVGYSLNQQHTQLQDMLDRLNNFQNAPIENKTVTRLQLLQEIEAHLRQHQIAIYQRNLTLATLENQAQLILQVNSQLAEIGSLQERIVKLDLSLGNQIPPFELTAVKKEIISRFLDLKAIHSGLALPYGPDAANMVALMHRQFIDIQRISTSGPSLTDRLDDIEAQIKRNDELRKSDPAVERSEKILAPQIKPTNSVKVSGQDKIEFPATTGQLTSTLSKQDSSLLSKVEHPFNFYTIRDFLIRKRRNKKAKSATNESTQDVIQTSLEQGGTVQLRHDSITDIGNQNLIQLEPSSSSEITSRGKFFVRRMLSQIEDTFHEPKPPKAIPPKAMTRYHYFHGENAKPPAPVEFQGTNGVEARILGYDRNFIYAERQSNVSAEEQIIWICRRKLCGLSKFGIEEKLKEDFTFIPTHVSKQQKKSERNQSPNRKKTRSNK